MVKKKDTTKPRICMDYRDLNKIIKFENYPFPRTHEILKHIGKTKWFLALNLSNGYWQISMDKFDKEKIAFISQFGTFEFNQMSFRLMCALATF